MILTNGQVILPFEVRDDVDIVVRDGKIADIVTRSTYGDAIDLRGNFLAPGFVDVHVHGAVARDTMEGTGDAFRAICDYHATGGTTSLLLTTATAPLEKICAVLEGMRKVRSQISQIAGAHVEGPFISRDKAGAQNTEFICEPTAELVTRLLDYRDVIKRITIAPEIRGATEAIKKICEQEISVSGGHSNARDVEARAAFENGMRSVTHTFNCMSSARREGIFRVAGLLEFALAEPEINCELIADGFHVAPTLMKMLYRAKGAHGISLVTDAIAGAGLPNGAHFQLGGKECVVENGVCLLADKSALAGSASRMIDLVRTMVNKVGVPLQEAIATGSRNPARAVGLRGKGEIVVGNDADFVVLSPQLEVIETYVHGLSSFRAKR